MEIDDDVASETDNPVEEISDDEEETNSPHKADEEHTRKRHRESADESESTGREAPSSVPFVPMGGSSPTRASSSSTLEGMEVLNISPLAYRPPPPEAKKPRVSTRWDILKTFAGSAAPLRSSSRPEKTLDPESQKTTTSTPPATSAAPPETQPVNASTDLLRRREGHVSYLPTRISFAESTDPSLSSPRVWVQLHAIGRGLLTFFT